MPAEQYADLVSAHDDEDDEEAAKVGPLTNPRHELFCKTYVSNGMNATQAYISVGYASAGATANASFLIAKHNVTRRIAELSAKRDAKLHEQLNLTLEKTLEQIAAISQFDQRKLFYPDGTPVPMHLLDAATSAAISHIGKHGPVPFNKMAGIDMAMKYLGAYEKDNEQKANNLALQVVLE